MRGQRTRGEGGEREREPVVPARRVAAELPVPAAAVADFSRSPMSAFLTRSNICLAGASWYKHE